MFVSQLFEGSISDKQIVLRSGFLETVKQKVQCGELKEGDAIMAFECFGNNFSKKQMNLLTKVIPQSNCKVSLIASEHSRVKMADTKLNT